MRRLIAAIRSLVTRCARAQGAARAMPTRRRLLAAAAAACAAIWRQRRLRHSRCAVARRRWLGRATAGSIARLAASTAPFVATSAELGFTVERRCSLDGRSETTSVAGFSRPWACSWASRSSRVDPVATRARLLTLPLGARRRRSSDACRTRLYVRITETVAAGALAAAAAAAPARSRRRVIADAPYRRASPTCWSSSAPDAPENAGALLDMLASQPELRKRVTAAIRIGGRRWNLHSTTASTSSCPERNSRTQPGPSSARLERDYGILAARPHGHRSAPAQPARRCIWRRPSSRARRRKGNDT